jgi:hypothetical protein
MSYYSQFDKSDTDSWQGKDWDADEEIGDEDFSPEPREEDDDDDGLSLNEMCGAL